MTSFSRRHLPHIYIPNSCYFITFRLADSLPVSAIQKYREIYGSASRKIITQNPDDDKRRKLLITLNDRYFMKIDRILDQCRSGNRYLQNPEIAKIVASALRYFDKNEYRLICYTIMPNHVHTLFTLEKHSRPVSKIMQSLKGFTAHEANLILKQKGVFWQNESYDHIIRDERDLKNKIKYVINNPVKAGLVELAEDWTWTYLSEIPIT
ncbi:MAG: transposase [Candidatus Marinimicrobia bacterium]|nr:transposase [Candidatus Neomarinimicrobiota bacterium]